MATPDRTRGARLRSLQGQTSPTTPEADRGSEAAESLYHRLSLSSAALAAVGRREPRAEAARCWAGRYEDAINSLVDDFLFACDDAEGAPSPPNLITLSPAGSAVAGEDAAAGMGAPEVRGRRLLAGIGHSGIPSVSSGLSPVATNIPSVSSGLSSVAPKLNGHSGIPSVSSGLSSVAPKRQPPAAPYRASPAPAPTPAPAAALPPPPPASSVAGRGNINGACGGGGGSSSDSDWDDEEYEGGGDEWGAKSGIRVSIKPASAVKGQAGSSAGDLRKAVGAIKLGLPLPPAAGAGAGGGAGAGPGAGARARRSAPAVGVGASGGRGGQDMSSGGDRGASLAARADALIARLGGDDSGALVGEISRAILGADGGGGGAVLASGGRMQDVVLSAAGRPHDAGQLVATCELVWRACNSRHGGGGGAGPPPAGPGAAISLLDIARMHWEDPVALAAACRAATAVVLRGGELAAEAVAERGGGDAAARCLLWAPRGGVGGVTRVTQNAGNSAGGEEGARDPSSAVVPAAAELVMAMAGATGAARAALQACGARAALRRALAEPPATPAIAALVGVAPPHAGHWATGEPLEAGEEAAADAALESAWRGAADAGGGGEAGEEELSQAEEAAGGGGGKKGGRVRKFLGKVSKPWGGN